MRRRGVALVGEDGLDELDEPRGRLVAEALRKRDDARQPLPVARRESARVERRGHATQVGRKPSVGDRAARTRREPRGRVRRRARAAVRLARREPDDLADRAMRDDEVRHAVRRLVDEPQQLEHGDDRGRVGQRRASFVARGHAERLQLRDRRGDIVVCACEDGDRVARPLAVDARGDLGGHGRGSELRARRRRRRTARVGVDPARAGGLVRLVPQKAPLVERARVRALARRRGDARIGEEVAEAHRVLEVGIRDEPGEVVLNPSEHAVHEVHHDRRRSVAPGERLLGPEERVVGRRDLADEAGHAAAPAVDRLLGVAHEEEPARATRAVGAKDALDDGPERAELRDRGVLRLVDREVADRGAERVEQPVCIRDAGTRGGRRARDRPAHIAEVVDRGLLLRAVERRGRDRQRLERALEAARDAGEQRAGEVRPDLRREALERGRRQRFVVRVAARDGVQEAVLREPFDVPRRDACRAGVARLQPVLARRARLRRRDLGARKLLGEARGIARAARRTARGHERRPAPRRLDRIGTAGRARAVVVEHRHRLSSEQPADRGEHGGLRRPVRKELDQLGRGVVPQDLERGVRAEGLELLRIADGPVRGKPDIARHRRRDAVEEPVERADLHPVQSVAERLEHAPVLVHARIADDRRELRAVQCALLARQRAERRMAEDAREDLAGSLAREGDREDARRIRLATGAKLRDRPRDHAVREPEGLPGARVRDEDPALEVVGRAHVPSSAATPTVTPRSPMPKMGASASVSRMR